MSSLIVVPQTDVSAATKKKNIKVTGISFERAGTGKITLYKGQSYILGTTVSPSNATKKSVKYSLNKKNIVSVTAKGKVKALKNGSVTLTATAKDGSKKKAKLKITVVDKKKITKVKTMKATGKTIELIAGRSAKLGVTMKPAKASNKNLLYKSNKKKVAVVSSNGMVTAVKKGNAKITIQTLDGTKKKTTVKVKVTPEILVSQITLNQSDVSIMQGNGITLAASVLPSNATNKNVIWTSSNPAIASVNAYGTVSALSVGQTVITATAEDGSGKSASAVVTVTKKVIPVTSVYLPSNAYVNQGKSKKLDITIRPYNATDKTVIWTSSDNGIVTVDANGYVTGISRGAATITAHCGEKTDTCQVTVNGSVNISFDSQGGNEIAPISSFERSVISEPVPLREKYVFKGWYMERECINKFDFSQPLAYENITLYAKWEEEYVTLDITQKDAEITEIHPSLAGIFSTNGNIKSISYTIKDTASLEGEVKVSGMAVVGNDTWEISKLELSPGENVITVKADTYSGSTDEKIIILSYNRGLLNTAPDIKDICGVKIEEDGTISIPETADDTSTEESGSPYVKNRLIIYFEENIETDRKAEILTKIGATEIGSLNTIQMCQVELPTGYENMEDLEAYVEELCDSYSEIVSAEPEWIIIEPENKIYNDTWNLADWDVNNPADENWWAEAVNAPLAWEYADQMTPVRVGIIDNGFDTEHEDLNIHFSNSARKTENSKEKHGTHVAGIIGANADNGKGITGLAWMNQVYGYDWEPAEKQNWTTSTKIQDLYIEAIEDGCKVVNMSLGTSGNLKNNKKKFTKYRTKSWGRSASIALGKLLEKGFDFVVVQSAGNGAKDLMGVDAINNSHFASINENNCYESDEVSKKDIMNRILIVGAAEQKDTGYQQTSFSNGGSTVNIAAPGKDIYSTLPDNGYGKLSGTSMAAPIVTATASMVWAVNDQFSGEEVQEILLTKTDKVAYDNTDSANTSGDFPMVNAGLAVEEAINRGGTVKGYFSNAVNGKRIQASYVIHKETAEGEIVGNENGYTSDEDGEFEISNLRAGTYVLEINAEGYVTNYAAIEVPIRGEVNMGTISLTKEIDPDAYRIVLTWGEEPEDLDSHLRAVDSSGEDVHIYFNNEYDDSANLDWDDTTSYGPETITITDFKELSGIRYAVHNYTDADANSDDPEAIRLANSEAVVKVYRGSSLLKTYEVPKNIKGTVWTVFSISGNGEILDINSMGYQSSASRVLGTSNAYDEEDYDSYMRGAKVSDEKKYR